LPPSTGGKETNAMSRGLRIEYPGATYHVTSRGNQRGNIVIDDQDRNDFWERVRETVIRFRWEMYAAALLTNHFHLFLRTLEANLSRSMQSLLSGYAQHWNARHHRIGMCFKSATTATD
jgi:REP element-mobilizing transposase RayT